jgi:hypothetical protein
VAARREAAGAVVPHHFIPPAIRLGRTGEAGRLAGGADRGALPRPREPEADARMHPAARWMRRSGASENGWAHAASAVVLIDGLDEYDPPAGAGRDPLAAFLPHACRAA